MTPTHTTRRAGFTLAELVVALGIMGVGMTMAAALFPAAMIGIRRCQDDVDGTITCNNVMAVLAERRLDMQLAAGSFGANYAILADEDVSHTTVIPLIDQHTPQGAAASRTGFALLARAHSLGNPDQGYHILAVAYRKQSAGNLAVFGNVPVGPQTDYSKLPDAADGRPWLRNALVIDPVTGQYARVVDLDGNHALLGNRLDLGPIGGFVWVLQEQDGSGNVVSSPGTCVLSVWTDF